MPLGERSKIGKLKVLEGQKVRLRPVVESDIPQLLKWDNDQDITRWAGKKFANDRDAKDWHLRTSLQRRTFAVELLDGRLVGEIEVLNISWRLRSGEMRICIGDKGLWDRGLGTDAVRTLSNGFFASTALEELFLKVDDDNARAKRCYEKAGFRAEGRLRYDFEEGFPRTLLLMRLRKRPADTNKMVGVTGLEPVTSRM